MNLHSTQTLTRVTKLDYNGQPYEVTVIQEPVRKTKAELWEWFRNREQVQPLGEFDSKGYIKYEQQLKLEQDGY